MSDKNNQKDNNKEEVDLTEKLKAAQEESEQKEEKAKNEDNEIEKLKLELGKMTEMAKRAMADLQNIKRRQSEEFEKITYRANARLLKDILPAIDNLKRSLNHVPAEAKKWADGISMSIKQLGQSLENSGLKVIETLGKKFDPDLHEALLQGPGKKDIIIEELEVGYKLGDQVIRHSKVKVGDGS